MPTIKGDEECVLCLGTGWQTDAPIVLGLNEDGTDILSEPRVAMCRCALLEQPSDEDEDFDDENMDDDSHSPLSPYDFGGSLVLA